MWTVRQFDETYTAPHHGFLDATDYYHRASAMRVVAALTVPTLIVTAADDPFVPVGPFNDPAVTANPNISVVVTAPAASIVQVVGDSQQSGLVDVRLRDVSLRCSFGTLKTEARKYSPKHLAMGRSR